jgi:thiamine-monophosphate kinase
LLDVSAGQELVLTTDVLVEGVHFLPDSAPRSIGHRALAVNLSDIAAMGAAPAWALLSLTLPEPDELWLGDFAAGFHALARLHGVALVGGNLSRGPRSVTVQLAGLVPRGDALRRTTAHVGDLVCVSGTVGDAGAGVALRQGRLAAGAAEADWLCRRFEYPTPRVELGQRLRGIASACIDVSDGLLGDLQRLAAASGCGADVEIGQLPVSAALRAAAGADAWRRSLAGGEDYELCFAVPPARLPTLRALGAELAVACTPCAILRAEPGIALHRDGGVIQFSHSPFDHFAH